MDLKYRVWSGMLQTPEKRPLGTCTYVLLLSYFTRALEQPEKTRPEELLVDARRGAQGSGLIPERTVCFSRLSTLGSRIAKTGLHRVFNN